MCTPTVDDEWLEYMTEMCDANVGFVDNRAYEPFVPPPELATDAELKAQRDGALVPTRTPSPDIAPEATDLYISTKTIITRLTSPINLGDIFWKLPVMPFWKPAVGIIKKQLKFDLTSQDEVDSLMDKLAAETSYCVMTLDNKDVDLQAAPVEPTSVRERKQKKVRQFCDKRIVRVGMSKKDIRPKSKKKAASKRAFLNCVVLIYRIKMAEEYTEIHVKLFNTGKVEIPGIQSDQMLASVMELVRAQVAHFIPGIQYTNAPHTIVLVNSNFNCGFYIDRDEFNAILRHKYNITTVFDPWYPGVQCKFYYDPMWRQTQKMLTWQNTDSSVKYTRVSFMIFRTGSVLIMGKCTEDVLFIIYEFLKELLRTEYPEIKQLKEGVGLPDLNELESLPYPSRARKMRKPRTQQIVVTK